MEGLLEAADKTRLRETLLAPLPSVEPQAERTPQSRAAEMARFALVAGPEMRGEIVWVKPRE